MPVGRWPPANAWKPPKARSSACLVDAYQRRDQVGLVVFQRDKARLVLPPTTSVELAQKALRDLPVGGKTPLSNGLYMAWQVIENARRRDSEIRPLDDPARPTARATSA